MVIDPRYLDPTLPIYETPDRILDNQGRIRRRQKDVIPAPDAIQQSRQEEYIRQIKDLAKTDLDLAKQINLDKIKREFAEDLKDIVARGVVEALSTTLGGIGAKRGRFDKPIENGGGAYMEYETAEFEIIRNECEICILYRESSFDSLSRYAEEEGYSSVYDIDPYTADSLVLPRRETITCWRSNKPECREVPTPPLPELPTETPPDYPPYPEPPPFDPNQNWNCGLWIYNIRDDTVERLYYPDLIDDESNPASNFIPVKLNYLGILPYTGSGDFIINPHPNSGVWTDTTLPYTWYSKYSYSGYRLTFEFRQSWRSPWLQTYQVGQTIELLNYTRTDIFYGWDNIDDFYANPAEHNIGTGIIKSKVKPYKNCPKPPKSDPPQPVIPMRCNCSKIEKDLEAIKKVLGVKRFPVNSPRRLIQPRSKGNVKLKDYPALFENLTRQIDRAVGFLPMTIEIKDSNLVQAGNQPIVVQVESIADGLREILQILCNDEATGDATQNIALRTLYEAGITHKLAAEIKAELDEVQEFLGYEIKEKTVEVPFAYNPLAKGLTQADKGTEEEIANVLPQILEQSKVKIRVGENVDKKTLYSMIQEIHTQATVAAAGVSERVGSRSALDNLMDGAQVAMDIAQLLQQRQILKILGGLSKTEFENLMNELELRYTKDKSPVPEDIGEPYQQDNQPKIKLVQLDPSRLTPPGVD